MARERIVTGESGGEIEERENFALRPLRFAQYIGQDSLIRKLRIAVEAARSRKEPVNHTLLHGPPGLGKRHLPTSLPTKSAHRCTSPTARP